MEALRALIRAELDKQGLSYREAAARAKGLISYSTLNVIATGRHTGELNDSTLTGIALALDVSVKKVREAYGLTGVAPTEFKLPERADRLTAKQRKAVIAMVDAFLDQHNGKTQPG